MRHATSITCIITLFFVSGYLHNANAGQQPIPLPQVEKLVVQSKQKKIAFTVEVAKTPEEMTQGLMYRKKMAADHGMLFLFPQEMVVSFWMKNTYIPLDMIFFNKEGRIVHLHPNAVPLSLDMISSKYISKAVLELNAGSIKKYGLATGDKLLQPSLQ